MNNPNNIGAPVTPARSRKGLWVGVGVIVVLAVGFGVGLFLFRNVFRPGQQQRVIEMAPQKPQDHLMVVNLSGRGDKDVPQVAEMLGDKL